MLTLVRRHLDRSIDTVGIGAASAQRRKRHSGPERRPAGPACPTAGQDEKRPARVGAKRDRAPLASGVKRSRGSGASTPMSPVRWVPPGGGEEFPGVIYEGSRVRRRHRSSAE